MVIEFPTVDLGGPPSTEESAPDGGAAFSSLVEGLLAEESASPEDGETDSADPNELPPFEAAVLFVVPPPVADVPPPNGWAFGEGGPGNLGQTVDAGAESAESSVPAEPSAVHASGLGASSAAATLRPVSTPSSLLPATPSGPVSPEQASATHPGLPAPPAPSADASTVSGVGVAEPLFPAPSTMPSVVGAVEGEPQVQPSTPAANATQPAVSETGDASQSDRAARKEARGYFERYSASTSDAVWTAVDAVQGAGALVEMGLDLGSPAGEGSRDGASSASSQGAVPAVAAGTAAASTSVAAPQATWMAPSQADDVVLPQLVRAMRLQLVGGVGEARIQLEPEHLGAVTVNLRVEAGVVSAVVTAEQSAVRQWVEQHETSLRQALAEQGLVLGKLHVERDGRSPDERPWHGHDETPRRRSPRKDTATFELLA